MEIPNGSKNTFRFFEDDKGRLRCLWVEMGIRKPVESVSGRRYNFIKVFGLYNLFSEKDIWKLQTGCNKEEIIVKRI